MSAPCQHRTEVVRTALLVFWDTSVPFLTCCVCTTFTAVQEDEAGKEDGESSSPSSLPSSSRKPPKRESRFHFRYTTILLHSVFSFKRHRQPFPVARGTMRYNSHPTAAVYACVQTLVPTIQSRVALHTSLLLTHLYVSV